MGSKKKSRKPSSGSPSHHQLGSGSPQSSALTLAASALSLAASESELLMLHQTLNSFADYKQFAGTKEVSVNIYTVTVKDIPSWYVHDSYLIEGYRGCILSLFYWHNESINVYTHLIGALSLLPVAYLLFSVWISEKGVQFSFLDVGILSIYLVGLFTCLALSTIFHLFCCHSVGVCKTTNRCDYAGIVALQVGSFVPFLNYAFHCDPFYKNLYCGAIVLLGLATVYVTVGPTYAAVNYRWLRTGLFSSFGALGVVPVIHNVAKYGINMAVESLALKEIAMMAALYLTGAWIYAIRVPERWYPKTFDIIGSSHQIWHLFVLAGAAMHFAAIFYVFIWWKTNNPTCALSDEEMISLFN